MLHVSCCTFVLHQVRVAELSPKLSRNLMSSNLTSAVCMFWHVPGRSYDNARFQEGFLEGSGRVPCTRVKWVAFILSAFFPVFYSIFSFKIGRFPFKT